MPPKVKMNKISLPEFYYRVNLGATEDVLVEGLGYVYWVSEQEWMLRTNYSSRVNAYIPDSSFMVNGKIAIVVEPDFEELYTEAKNDLLSLLRSHYTKNGVLDKDGFNSLKKLVDDETITKDKLPHELRNNWKVIYYFHTTSELLLNAGQTYFPTRGKTAGATPGTSFASIFGRDLDLVNGKFVPREKPKVEKTRWRDKTTTRKYLGTNTRGAIVGRAVPVVGLGVGVAGSAYNIYESDNKPRTITQEAGGWAGAWVGMKVGGVAGVDRSTHRSMDRSPFWSSWQCCRQCYWCWCRRYCRRRCRRYDRLFSWCKMEWRAL